MRSCKECEAVLVDDEDCANCALINGLKSKVLELQKYIDAKFQHHDLIDSTNYALTPMLNNENKTLRAKLTEAEAKLGVATETLKIAEKEIDLFYTSMEQSSRKQTIYEGDHSLWYARDKATVALSQLSTKPVEVRDVCIENHRVYGLADKIHKHDKQKNNATLIVWPNTEEG